MPYLQYKNITVYYNMEGTGLPVLLLHGYLENSQSWGLFASLLAKDFCVIAPDIPGHGASGIIADEHSMDLLADVMAYLLQQLGMESVLCIGHSMGGYVMLALADRYPQLLRAMVMLHSTATADTEERKKMRLQTIDALAKGDADNIIRGFVPKTFAQDNVSLFGKEIERLTDLALKTDPQGIISLLRGMMSRPDRCHVLQQTEVPVLFVIGKKDVFISEDMALKQASMPKKADVILLNASGHMGHIEQRDDVLQGITAFIRKSE